MDKQDLEKSLKALRTKIDAIDVQILSLLKSRFEIVHEVGELKNSHNENFFIRSAREADMLRALIDLSEDKLPNNLIIDLWRKIITSANVCEQPIKIGLYCQKEEEERCLIELYRYYNNEIEIKFFDKSEDLFLEIEEKEIQIAAIDLFSQDSSWWLNLATKHKSIKLFTKIPFLTQGKKEIMLFAIKEAEKSSSDETVIYVEAPLNIDPAIFTSKVLAKARKKGKMIYLLSYQKFITEAELSSIDENNQMNVKKIIGYFPIG